MIGEETHRLRDGRFEAEVLGQIQLKGLQRKVKAFRMKETVAP